jgi:fatty-acyl-CoA synthase
VPDERFVEEICAWVIPRDGVTVDPDEVRAFCQGRIAHYKIPRYVCATTEFPMTVTGKVRKVELRERAIDELDLHVAAATKTA